MELMHQLTPQLKRLRLSGVLESLELRNQQAIRDKLSYVEFLARLIQDLTSPSIEAARRAIVVGRLRIEAINRCYAHQDRSGLFGPLLHRLD